MEKYIKFTIIIKISESDHSAAFTTHFEKIYLSSSVLLILHKKGFYLLGKKFLT